MGQDNNMGRSLGILLAFVLLAGSCNKGPQEEAGGGMGGMMDGPPPVAVFVAPVQMVDYSPAIKLIGETRAEQRAVLAAEVAGKVTAIRHRVGERHNEADGWLIRIDPSSYKASADAAEASLRQAEENLNKANNGPREEDIRAQQAQVAAARARLHQAEDNLSRMQALADAGVIAESALIAAKTETETARAALKAAEEVLSAMQAGARIEDRNSAEASVSMAQSNLSSSRISLGRTSVAPEFDSVVSALMVEVGQYVGPGTPLVEVVSAEGTEAWFNLPEEELSNVDIGDDVEMRFAAFPDEVFHGALISVSPAANEQTRQFPLRVVVSDSRIRPGMTVEGRILRGTAVPTKMIDMDSVIQSPLGTICWVMDSDPSDPMKTSARQVTIVTGARLDNMVVVESEELQPGMMVVTRGKQQVYPTAVLIPVNLMPPGGMGGAPGGPDGPGGPPDGKLPAEVEDTAKPADAPAAVAPPQENGTAAAEDKTDSGNPCGEGSAG
jgi:RND family efflux transporter MFP subunit